MTVSSSTNRASYSGNGSTTVFAYGFRIFDQDDLTVILRAADGTETTQTITTHYTVSGVGSVSGGNVTFGTAPASGVTVVILREQPLTQGLDLVANDPFPSASFEDQLDKLTFMIQQHDEELGRAIKASKTNTITGSEFTISAADRANKIFAFDSSGDVNITQEIGTYKGNWAASTAYVVRDLVKDTSTNNIFIVNSAHTSSGSQPLTTNTNSAKYDLIVDAATASTSATAAATSATAAATSETNAGTSATNASTSAANAASSATAAASSAASAAASYDSFDDRYLGAKSSAPSVDNDGDALVTGALYFNTTTNKMQVYSGSAFEDVAPTATSITASQISDITATASELNYVDGVTSAIQTQIDAKAPTASPTFSGTVSDGDGDIRAIPQSGSAKTTSYSLATSDVGNFIEVGSGGSITIPDATFSAGDAVSIFNNTTGNVTVTCTITTAYISGTDTDQASVTLATRGICTVLFISGTTCVITGNVS